MRKYREIYEERQELIKQRNAFVDKPFFLFRPFLRLKARRMEKRIAILDSESRLYRTKLYRSGLADSLIAELESYVYEGKKEMKIEKTGLYEANNGRRAIIHFITEADRDSCRYAIGQWQDELSGYESWIANSGAKDEYKAPEWPENLVRFFEKEPSSKRIVKMAPVLCRDGDVYWLSDDLYASESAARANNNLFVRWLIDSHAVDVEVEE